MYRIAVLTDHEVRGQQLSRWVRMFSEEWGLFPAIEHYENPECFFYTVQKFRPDGVIVEISGVSGLNTVEHLRSLCPECRLIWCSDLDFSQQAYRLWVEYFMLYPATEGELKNGLSRWYENRGYQMRHGKGADKPKPELYEKASEGRGESL